MYYVAPTTSIKPPGSPAAYIHERQHLRNEFNFSNVHGIMNTSGLVQKTRSIHDSMNIPKIEFITYIYILYYQSSINFQFSPNLADFPVF